jgi:hypothetical protein
MILFRPVRQGEASRVSTQFCCYAEYANPIHQSPCDLLPALSSECNYYRAKSPF